MYVGNVRFCARCFSDIYDILHRPSHLQFNFGTGAAVSSICVKMWRVLVVWEAGMKRVKIKNAVLFR